jgi:pre-rRNA-processing protein TSR3
MQEFPITWILRHRRENLKKCSLRGLEGRKDLQFYTYPIDTLPPLDGTIVLSVEAPLLTEADAQRRLLLIDGTWKHASVMFNQLPHPERIEKRSLPPELKTAYPRRQEDCIDPDRGLASIEALYAAYVLLKRNPEGLLDHYHWKKAFLEKNAFLFYV